MLAYLSCFSDRGKLFSSSWVPLGEAEHLFGRNNCFGAEQHYLDGRHIKEGLSGPQRQLLVTWLHAEYRGCLGSGSGGDHGSVVAVFDGGALATAAGGICFPSPLQFMLMLCLVSLLRSSSKPSTPWKFWMIAWWTAFRCCS